MADAATLETEILSAGIEMCKHIARRERQEKTGFIFRILQFSRKIYLPELFPMNENIYYLVEMLVCNLSNKAEEDTSIYCTIA